MRRGWLEISRGSPSGTEVPATLTGWSLALWRVAQDKPWLVRRGLDCTEASRRIAQQQRREAYMNRPLIESTLGSADRAPGVWSPQIVPYGSAQPFRQPVGAWADKSVGARFDRRGCRSALWRLEAAAPRHLETMTTSRRPRRACNASRLDPWADTSNRSCSR
jgi:hypothetical protein